MDKSSLEEIAISLGSYYLSLKKEHEKRKKNKEPLFNSKRNLDYNLIRLCGKDETSLILIKDYMKIFFESKKEEIKIIFEIPDSPYYSIDLSNPIKLEEEIQFSFYKD
jgi:hypothetical protein